MMPLSSSVLNWVLLPFRLGRSFTGHSQLPIHALDRRTVITPGARTRPLGAATRMLQISAWRLVHSIIKADCARHSPSLWLRIGAAGFLIEHFHLFHWDPENLRLADGMADAYADFTRTSLAGRIAQGMTILFMEDQGFAFVDRFAAFLRRHNGHRVAGSWPRTTTGSASSRKRRFRTPDFVFEKHSIGSTPPARALAESKGGFVAPGQNADIKRDLSDALDQLDGWGGRLSPPINKSFAVGTYLREAEDQSTEPSLLAFVDPEPGEPEGTIEYQPDAIRRANYAAWLTGMGFNDAALRVLARAQSRETRLRLPVITLGNRRYAVAIASVEPEFTRDPVLDDEFWWMLEQWPFWPSIYYPRAGLSLHIMGLEIGVLRSLGDATTTGTSDRLMALEPVIEREPSLDVDAGSFLGSIFMDGTIVGDLQVSRGSRPRFGVEEVAL